MSGAHTLANQRHLMPDVNIDKVVRQQCQEEKRRAQLRNAAQVRVVLDGCFGSVFCEIVHRSMPDQKARIFEPAPPHIGFRAKTWYCPPSGTFTSSDSAGRITFSARGKKNRKSFRRTSNPPFRNNLAASGGLILTAA